MSTIISMLIISFFTSIRNHGWFLLLYATFLLLAKELRLFVNEYIYMADGRFFFEYYSYIQLLAISLAFSFLSGWIRILSISSFVLFSFYNYLIFYLWGELSIDYYDYIALGIICFNILLVTWEDKGLLKNIGLMVLVFLATLGGERFI